MRPWTITKWVLRIKPRLMLKLKLIRISGNLVESIEVPTLEREEAGEWTTDSPAVN
jgi:hypothetical protein